MNGELEGLPGGRPHDARAVAVLEADEDDVEAPEGKLLYRMHRHRERSSQLVDRLKAAASV